MFTDAALDLTRFGWKVFPLQARTKIPAIPKQWGGKGCLDATDDENIIADWGRKYPQANIGLATGKPSGLVVIDFDPRNGSDASIAWLASRKQTFPATVSARTASGGTHLYYAYEPSLKNSKSVLAAGIDVKTTGGYVVAPPSLLAEDQRYSWVISPLGEHLPRLPRWVTEALKPKPEPIRKAYDKAATPKDIQPLVAFVAQTGDGSRNNALYWAACRLAEQGLLDGGAEQALIDAAQSAGLDRIDAQKTVASARKKGRLA